MFDSTIESNKHRYSRKICTSPIHLCVSESQWFFISASLSLSGSKLPIFFLTTETQRGGGLGHFWSIRHDRGWQFIPLVLFVLVLVLSETVLVLEGKHRGFVDKRAKYWGFSVPEKVIDLNRHGRFRVRVRVRVPQR